MKPLSIAFAILLFLTLLLGLTGCTQDNPSPSDGDTNGDVTAPTSPADLAKATPDSDTTPTFTWQAANDEHSGVARYLLSIDSGGWSDIGDVTDYECQTALSDGMHTFEVKAVDEAGNESAAVSLTFVVDTTSPTISAVSITIITDRSAMVAWATDEPATSQVEYGLSESYGETNPLDTSLVTSHSMTLTGLQPDTVHHLRATSSDASGNMASSTDSSFVTLPDTTPPGVPPGLALSNGYREVNVEWAPVAGDDLAGYYVYRSNLPDSGYVQLNSEPTASTSYLDTGLDPDTTCYYQLAAVDLYYNESERSVAASTTTLTIAQASPAYLSYGGILITGGGSYEYLECHIANSSLRSITIEEVEVLDQTDSQVDTDAGLQVVLNPGEEHSYNVYYQMGWMPDLGGWKVKWQCVDAEGAQFIALGLSTVPDTTSPTISAVSPSDITGNSVTITWTTNEAATSQVQYGIGMLSSTSQLDSALVKDHSVSLTGLYPASTYDFRVRSKDAAGNEALSDYYSFTTLGTLVGGIISENTTWTKSAIPYVITETVQIPLGVTLTIEPGATVTRLTSGDMFLVHGTVYAHGTVDEKITFDGGYNSDFFSAEFSTADAFVDVEYCIFRNGLAFWPATGNAVYGHFNLRYSELTNLSWSYIWYPGNDIYIEYNAFTNCGGFSVGTGANVYIRYNLFNGKNPSLSGSADFCIQQWTGSGTVVEFNSFINIDGIALKLAGGTLSATHNYWGTQDTAVIDSMIYDQNDDITCPGYIDYLPILTAPHPDAPLP